MNLLTGVIFGIKNYEEFLLNRMVSADVFRSFGKKNYTWHLKRGVTLHMLGFPVP